MEVVLMLYKGYAALAGNYKGMAQWLLFRERVGAESPPHHPNHAIIMIEMMPHVAASTTSVEKPDSKIDHLDAKIDRLDAKIDRMAAELSAQIERNAKESTRWLMGVVISVAMLQSALVTGLVFKLIP
ncbi:DUF1640 domain-containing protein [Duganella vulcania]|uniref:DUF1640 domain-containing protein n=1 Tax=Duganella vulcania TaxID=2692166 RepID=A0A845GZ03_9BURK|nr:DUF1640 domain-containing protein [Duganella vulcania]MYM97897.1 DUF1640 domain-containing protein [Duganella vulcania]